MSGKTDPKENATKTKSWGTGKVTKMPKKSVGELMRDLDPEDRNPMYPEPEIEQGIVIASFVCPICASNEYETLRKMSRSQPGLIGSGNKISYVVVGYRCSGCTVPFSDPRKFTKNREG